jgi:hypothetical protein
MSREEMTRAWWKYCEKNSRYIDRIPTFDEFRENILPNLETVDTETKTELY